MSMSEHRNGMSEAFTNMKTLEHIVLNLTQHKEKCLMSFQTIVGPHLQSQFCMSFLFSG